MSKGVFFWLVFGAFLLLVLLSVVRIVGDISFTWPLTTQKSEGRVSTNEVDLVALTAELAVNLENVEETFLFVLDAIEQEVFVYPTENYYYFRFLTAGKEIWGNIRLDAGDRQEGRVSFAYFEIINRPQAPDEFVSHHKDFAAADGLTLTAQDDFTYDLQYEGRRVRFHLNQLAQTPPPTLRGTERFVMRTQDESGFKFFLLFDEAEEHFMFVLDESEQLPDQIKPYDAKVLIGQRSGFAFYDDATHQRKILMAVDTDNLKKNNYFDGPFDQLADNFVHDDTLKNYLERAYPYVRGRIDQRGVFTDQDGSRVAISPYANYTDPGELIDITTHCEAQPELYSCIAYDYKRDVPGIGEN